MSPSLRAMRATLRECPRTARRRLLEFRVRRNDVIQRRVDPFNVKRPCFGRGTIAAHDPSVIDRCLHGRAQTDKGHRDPKDVFHVAPDCLSVRGFAFPDCDESVRFLCCPRGSVCNSHRSRLMKPARLPADCRHDGSPRT
jgi:hypothetical protein